MLLALFQSDFLGRIEEFPDPLPHFILEGLHVGLEIFQ
jgi:hypothetical protein